MKRTAPTLAAHLTIAVATLIGGGTLALLGVFLFFGPVGLVDFGLGRSEILAWDAVLCLAFCVQHSAMVRQSFRRRLEKLVPVHYHGALYTLASAVVLLALVLLWHESPVVVFGLEGASRWVVRVVCFTALPGFLWSARSIAQFDPFGVAPIKASLRGRPPRAWPFTIQGPYRWVRHPQYFFALVLFWATPDLTADRLLFNVIFTAWVVLGTILEERDLVDQFGNDYREYQQQVPMLIPWPQKGDRFIFRPKDEK